MPCEKTIIISAALSRVMQAQRLQVNVSAPVQRGGVSRVTTSGVADEIRGASLFMLRRYDEKTRNEVLATVSRNRTSIETIKFLFECVASPAQDAGRSFDCFPAIAALPLASHDAYAEFIVMESFSEVERFFGMLIRKGQESGEISGNVDPKRVAAMLFATLVGLRVMAAGGPDKSMLEAVIRQALALIGNRPGKNNA